MKNFPGGKGFSNINIQVITECNYSKTCLKQSLKKDQKLAFKADYR